jgi:hypothetical protein
VRVANPERAIQHYVSAFNMTSFLNDNLLSCLQLYHFPACTYIYVEQDVGLTQFFGGKAKRELMDFQRFRSRLGYSNPVTNATAADYRTPR